MIDLLQRHIKNLHMSSEVLYQPDMLAFNNQNWFCMLINELTDFQCILLRVAEALQNGTITDQVIDKSGLRLIKDLQNISLSVPVVQDITEIAQAGVADSSPIVLVELTSKVTQLCKVIQNHRREIVSIFISLADIL